jgi:inhibitor of cysteine peptidase
MRSGRPLFAIGQGLLLAVLMLGLPPASMALPAFPHAVSGLVTSEIRISEQANGSTVLLTTGQLLVLTLPSNPSTGYAWKITALNSRLLKESAPAQTARSSVIPIPGEPGTVVYRFMAIGEGSGSLALSYRRAFEAATIPARKEFKIQVQVQAAKHKI